MTNHWRDIKNADLILINGANPAEAHPVGFQWFMRAKLDRGAKIVHADPRFTRTSAVADTYLRIRTGSDVAYFGGLINHVLQNNLFHDAYVRNYTNASFPSRTVFRSRTGCSLAMTQPSGHMTSRAGVTSQIRRPASRCETKPCKTHVRCSS